MPMPQLPPELLQQLIALLSRGGGGAPGASPAGPPMTPQGVPGGIPDEDAVDPSAPMGGGPPGAVPPGLDPSALGGPGGEVDMPPALLEIMRRLKLQPSLR
jgi:hypothetical protein